MRMLKIGKPFVVSSCLALSSLLLSSSVMAQAASFQKSSAGNQTVVFSTNNTQQVKNFLDRNGITPPKGATPVGMETVVNSNGSIATGSANHSGVVKPNWGVPYFYLSNVTETPNGMSGVNPIGIWDGVGPMTLSETVSASVSAGWSATGGINADGVSAGVGFNVTQSFGVSGSGSVYVPKGHEYELRAYPNYNVYNFNVDYNPFLGNGYQVGNGEAWQPCGATFVWYVIS